MSTEHSDVAAELWALAQTVLTKLEPVLRQAMEDQRERPRQGCSWCPVCALAAMIRGEQHDLLTLLASEGASVVALIRQMVAEHSGSTPAESSSAESTHGHGADEPARPGDADPAFANREDRDGDKRDGGHSDDPTIASATDEPNVRRAGFVPITVTVKDATTSASVDEDR